MKKLGIMQPQSPPIKGSEQSTSQQTMTEYYKGGPLKNVIQKVEAAQDAVTHSRKKIQKFLANITSSKLSKQCDTLSLHSNPSTRSAGRIVNQAHSVQKFLTKNTKQLLKSSRKTVHEPSFRDPQPTPVHEQYLINIEIIQTLIESIEEEKKSNRIFEKQLKAKRELLGQMRAN